MPASRPVLTARGISRRYGRIAALTDVSVDVAAGECLAITGEPGSGRSTLLRIIGTVIRPSAGSLTIAGHDALGDLPAVRRRIAVADPACAAGIGLTVREYLQWTLRTRGPGAGIERTRHVRDALAADIAADLHIAGLPPQSRAMVSLAAALVWGPELLVFDRRASAEDDRVRAALDACVGELLAAGGAAIVAANTLEDVRPLATREVQLRGGRVVDAPPRPEARVAGPAVALAGQA